MIALFCATELLAQVPEYFSYQAVARASDGSPIIGQSIGIELELLRDSIGGTVVYGETHSTVTNEFGSFDIRIGDGAATTGNFNEIDWNEHPYFLRVGMDPAGGASYVVMGTSQLLSVPYSHYTKTSSYDLGQELMLGSLNDRLSTVEQSNEEQDQRLEELLDLINLYHPFNCGEVLIDVRDGNAYPTVLVGSDCWMAEGLRFDIDASGGSFSDGTGPTHIDTVGRYYNWAGAVAMDQTYNDSLVILSGTVRGVCPIGWHIPSDTEWNSLFTNTSFNGAGELLEGGTSGMEVKLGGRRSSGGTYQSVGTFGDLISITETNATDRSDPQVFMTGAVIFSTTKLSAGNVRCVMD